MPKAHDKIYYAVIWRLNWLAMKWVTENRITLEQGLYKGAVQLLHHAVRYRNYGFAQSLLKRGVDIDCRDALGATALRDACQRGHLSGMKWLIQQGADFESQKVELLFAAVRCSQHSIIKWLIEQGCDVNATNEDGQNPLQHCYDYCNPAEAEQTAVLLRQHGAITSDGNGPGAGKRG